MKKFLPYAMPHINDDDKHAIIKTLDSGQLVLGPKTEEFEQKLKKFLSRESKTKTQRISKAEREDLFVRPIGFGPELKVLRALLSHGLFWFCGFCVDDKKGVGNFADLTFADRTFADGLLLSRL